MRWLVPVTLALMTTACASAPCQVSNVAGPGPTWPDGAEIRAVSRDGAMELSWPSAGEGLRYRVALTHGIDDAELTHRCVETPRAAMQLAAGADANAVVVALDAEGRPSKRLSEYVVALDLEPPLWPAAAAAGFEVDLDRGLLKVTIPAARDNVAVERYAVFINDKLAWDEADPGESVREVDIASDIEAFTVDLRACDAVGCSAPRALEATVRTPPRRAAPSMGGVRLHAVVRIGGRRGGGLGSTGSPAWSRDGGCGLSAGFGADSDAEPPGCRERVRAPRGKITGACRERSVARVTAWSAGWIRQCYDNELGGDPALEGTVALAWTIGGDGEVLDARVTEDTVSREPLTRCVLNVVRSQRFEAPAEGTCAVSWPVHLAP